MMVGRGENAHVDGARLGAANPPDLLVLQDAQQLGLDGERQVRDLVQEERAGIGDFEQPRLGCVRIRERAPLVAEQFGLDELLRQGRAVDGNERRAVARSATVDRPREELLPGPRLADNQGARAPVRQESRRPRQLFLEGWALAHERGERVIVPVVPLRRARPSGVHRGAHGVPEDLEIVRQRKVVVRTTGHELHGYTASRVRTDHERRHVARDPVAPEPLDRVPLRATGCDDDGHRPRLRFDVGRRLDQVDHDAEVLRQRVPELAERSRDDDHTQSLVHAASIACCRGRDARKAS